MNITVASGKGGTGKTTFSLNLAYFLAEQGENIRLLDGDVEEPNDHLFLPKGVMAQKEVTVLKPKIDAEKCTACGECVTACNYNALALARKKLILFNELCHSCGACSYVCEYDAIEEVDVPIGSVFFSEPCDGRPFFFGYGLLNIGEALAPVVVKALKEYESKDAINILDASPGTACPVMAALSNDTIAVLVTEPTPFGLNDLKLAADLALSMGRPTGIVINRSDGEDLIIKEFAEQYNIPILGRIPFDKKYAETYSHGGILIHHHDELKPIFQSIFEGIKMLEGSIPSYQEIEINKESMIKQHQFTKGKSDDYTEFVVISGKGGTGKTTVTSALAQLSDGSVLFDADVDAADLHLLIKPEVVERTIYSGSDEYVIDPEKCIGCGKCEAICHFDSISLSGPKNDLVAMTYQISAGCEGCGLCERVCPVNAISGRPAQTGEVFVSATASGPMVHAKLGVGADNSGKLVSHVREKSANLVKELALPTIIGDGPPGTGCPVIASVTGVDYVLMVTEPTVSGVHDLERVLELIKHFGVKAFVIINKYDLNEEMVSKIESLSLRYNSKVICKIPFDRSIHDALMKGETIIKYGKGAAFNVISQLWKTIKEEIG